MFPEGVGFVNITVPEGGPTAAGMNPEDGTAKQKLPRFWRHWCQQVQSENIYQRTALEYVEFKAIQ